jgi:hypothetical protein
MPLSRIDLDGKGAGSPEGLVALILKGEPELAPPIPIATLCKQFDIADIREHETVGFEGALITDPDRHSGIILVNKASHKFRQRFTIGHELGHFLIPAHKPPSDKGFQCTRADMLRQNAKPNDRGGQMEVEANRFSSLILIPPPFLKIELRKRPSPDLQHIPKLAGDFEVSKEAMAHAYAEYHPEPVAIVVTQNGQVLRSYRNRVHFPFIQAKRGDAVPRGSLFHRVKHRQNVASDFAECLPDLWIEVKRGHRAPTLFEQVYSQQKGFALILLHLEQQDEEEEADEADLERSWEPKFRR